MQVLIVEDDLAERRLVIHHLEEQGIKVTAVHTAAAAISKLQHTAFDVVILDLKRCDGWRLDLDLLRTLRAPGSTTHVILLSWAGSEAERIRAFELGADDYMVKPLFVRELTARVLAVRRRVGVTTVDNLQFDRFAIDFAARQVTVDGVPVALTVKEFDLLAFMAARPRRTFSRAELLRSVWKSTPAWQHASTVTEHVRRLRSKLEPDSVQPSLLQTVRGVGYRFHPPSAA
jgi:DNA-binding response OmpR family regulator